MNGWRLTPGTILSAREIQPSPISIIQPGPRNPCFNPTNMPTATNIIGQVVTQEGKSRKVCLSIAPTPITSKNKPAKTEPVLCSFILFFIVVDFDTKLYPALIQGNRIKAIHNIIPVKAGKSPVKKETWKI